MAQGTPTGGRAPYDRRLPLTLLLIGLPNLAGAVLVFVFQNFVAPGPGADPETIRRVVGTFVVYIAVSFPIAAFFGYVLLRPVRAWLVDRRPPTPSELEATLTAPRRMGAMGFGFWLGGLVVFGTLAILDGDTARQVVSDGIATLLGGLTAAVLSFLLVESWLRPIVARALQGAEPPRRRSAGIAPRILLSWALGSGVPLLGILAAELRIAGDDVRPTPQAVLFLATLGLASGALLLVAAARSVAEPIAAVRHALRQVQRGDIEIEIAVDDAGQIGQLQAGFNEMVRGVRERRRLEDLFGRYVGEEVAADALERGAGLGGEQREVSALFVDIIRSTEFTHGRDPGEVVATLNDFFATVVSVVTAEGGWVNKFEGDGALCVFGAPGDQPDHATRALRAARLLRLALAEVRSRRPSLSAGIGVSTGVAVAGHVGAVERFEYTVIGDPVNEAARLTEAAKETNGCVLASAATVRAASGDERAAWERVATVTLRGRAAPTEAWAPSQHVLDSLA